MQSTGTIIQCLYQLIKPNEINSYKDYLNAINQSPLPTMKRVKRAQESMQSKSDSDLLSDTMLSKTRLIKKPRYSYDCSSVKSFYISEHSQSANETSIYSPIASGQSTSNSNDQQCFLQQQQQNNRLPINFSALSIDSKQPESYDNPFFDSTSSDEFLNSEDCVLFDFLQEEIYL
jgi:hypothetical protein